jgi:hypothetical protein
MLICSILLYKYNLEIPLEGLRETMKNFSLLSWPYDWGVNGCLQNISHYTRNMESSLYEV